MWSTLQYTTTRTSNSALYTTAYTTDMLNGSATVFYHIYDKLILYLKRSQFFKVFNLTTHFPYLKAIYSPVCQKMPNKQQPIKYPWAKMGFRG